MMSVCQTFGNEKNIILDYDGMRLDKTWYFEVLDTMSEKSITSIPLSQNQFILRLTFFCHRFGYETIRFSNNSQPTQGRPTRPRKSWVRRKTHRSSKLAHVSFSTRFGFFEVPLVDKRCTSTPTLSLQMTCEPWKRNERECPTNNARSRKRSASPGRTIWSYLKTRSSWFFDEHRAFSYFGISGVAR